MVPTETHQRILPFGNLEGAAGGGGGRAHAKASVLQDGFIGLQNMLGHFRCAALQRELWEGKREAKTVNRFQNRATVLVSGARGIKRTCLELKAVKPSHWVEKQSTSAASQHHLTSWFKFPLLLSSLTLMPASTGEQGPRGGLLPNCSLLTELPVSLFYFLKTTTKTKPTVLRQSILQKQFCFANACRN